MAIKSSTKIKTEQYVIIRRLKHNYIEHEEWRINSPTHLRGLKIWISGWGQNTRPVLKRK